jgi:hypothetical protein
MRLPSAVFNQLRQLRGNLRLDCVLGLSFVIRPAPAANYGVGKFVNELIASIDPLNDDRKRRGASTCGLPTRYSARQALAFIAAAALPPAGDVTTEDRVQCSRKAHPANIQPAWRLY